MVYLGIQTCYIGRTSPRNIYPKNEFGANRIVREQVLWKSIEFDRVRQDWEWKTEFHEVEGNTERNEAHQRVSI